MIKKIFENRFMIINEICYLEKARIPSEQKKENSKKYHNIKIKKKIDHSL